jgi:hypothetical protein
MLAESAPAPKGNPCAPEEPVIMLEVSVVNEAKTRVCRSQHTRYCSTRVTKPRIVVSLAYTGPVGVLGNSKSKFEVP